MTDLNRLPGQQNDTPEDVASLYSWANLHGGKYRDFSAARAETREKARQRVQHAAEEERSKALQQEDALPFDEVPRSLNPFADPTVNRTENRVGERIADSTPISHSRQLPTQTPLDRYFAEEQAAAPLAAQAGESKLPAAAPQAAYPVAEEPTRPAAPSAPPMIENQMPPVADWQGADFDRLIFAQEDNPARQKPPQQPAYAAYPDAQPPRPTPAQPQFGSGDDGFDQEPENSWVRPDPAEAPRLPAWLASEKQGRASGQFAVPQAPEDTLQGSRDRMATRWFALKGIFDGEAVPAETAPAPIPSRAPTVAVFSLAGGVGKTTVVATLGRALSARGEKVLLVDTAPFGLLPFFFGAQDQRPGQLRTFSPPSGGGDAPVQLVTIDPEAMSPEGAAQESLTNEIVIHAHGASRIIVDLATASGATARRILKLNPLVIIPVVPDMNSVVSVASIDAFFQRNASATGGAHLPWYVLNQFDPTLPLDLDVREVLRERLGDRLLPFALRRAPSVSEALAEGMTVIDYAPNSTVAEDFANLAGWLKSLSAPAQSTGFRGVRWSER